jgi:hypothetical protein
LFGSLPSLLIASLIQARSTTAGTPVKSYTKRKMVKLNKIKREINISESITKIPIIKHRIRIDYNRIK